MLTAGTTLGPYKILEPLGAGGMGEVYRAHDTRLGRDVAIKALPESFASDPDRLVRFEREAKVLASLNHPNVAGIYGVEEAGGHRYLALEYVEGETLAARLARGPLPLEEAIEMCLQIASGMEAAHESGVVHRDLKPGNVMITPGDRVKVVDFGLAKGKVAEPEAVSPESPTITESPALHHSPTMGTPATLPGVVLGTAAYLSPEQARGKVVDRRADIWSFGCVLYECLTGRRAFEGETVSDLVAGILRGEVEWSRLPKGTPLRLRELLQHCLEKDPRKRLRDIGDARLALEEVRQGKEIALQAASTTRTLSPRILALGGVLALASAVAGIGVWNGFGPGHTVASTPHGVKRLSVSLPPGIRVTKVNISPDGRYIVTDGRAQASAGDGASVGSLYRRALDSYQWEPVPGTEKASQYQFSPDGRWIYFLAPVTKGSQTLHIARVPVDGSAPPVAITRWEPTWRTFTTLANGDILATVLAARTLPEQTYVRVSATGGTSPPAKINAPTGYSGYLDFVNEGALPGDRGVFVSATSYEGGRWHMGIGVFDPKSGNVKLLVDEGECPRYAVTGHLVFTRRGSLVAVPFDLARLEVRGEAVAIAEGLATPEAWLSASFGLSRDGSLVYVPGGGDVGTQRRLIVVDGQGRVSDWTGQRATFLAPSAAVSWDGRRAASLIGNSSLLNDIWIYDRGSDAGRQIVAIPGTDCFAPVWSPDGAYLAFDRQKLDEEDGIYVQPLRGGPARRISTSGTTPTAYQPTSWSPDMSVILANQGMGSGGSIVQIPFDPATDTLQAPAVLLRGDPMAWGASFSPDGHHVAFTSTASGQREIYIAPYRSGTGLGTPIMVSVGGGEWSRWSRLGDRIFYTSPERRVLSVSITRRPELSAGTPVPRWDLDTLRAYTGLVEPDRQFEILPGDELLVVQMGPEEGQITRIDLVVGFHEELKEKLSGSGRVRR